MGQQDDKLEFFIEHRAALVDYATPITGCRARAEDIVHDAYLRFRASASEQTANLSAAYLYRIVRNHALDFVRRAAMESRTQTADTISWLTPATDADPEQHALHDNELRQVAAALRSLPERQRLAVEMHRFGDYTMRDIAVRLGVSAPTVHRLIRDAMLKIATQLDHG